MSQRKLVLAAVALILGVVGSVAWYLAEEAAERRAVRDERQLPTAAPAAFERPTSDARPARALRLGRQLARQVAADCPCRDAAAHG